MTIEPSVSTEQEIEFGNKANAAYEGFIKPFIAQKRYVLFDAFRDVPIENIDELKEIKRVLKTLDSLESEVLNIITTGKLASKQTQDK